MFLSLSSCRPYILSHHHRKVRASRVVYGCTFCTFSPPVASSCLPSLVVHRSALFTTRYCTSLPNLRQYQHQQFVRQHHQVICGQSYHQQYHHRHSHPFRLPLHFHSQKYIQVHHLPANCVILLVIFHTLPLFHSTYQFIMRIWTTEHTFQHPWDTVVQAVWRKYPNPLNPSVVGIDIVDRKVCPETSVMHTHRLISCKWGLPGWAEKLLGRDTSIASEHSQLDPKGKSFTLKSKNVSFCNEISIIEQLTYKPHPADTSKTVMTQETLVEVHGIPLSSYFEQFVYNDISKNALKGRQAMELVINKINDEVQEIAHKTAKSVDDLAGNTIRLEKIISEDLVTRSKRILSPELNSSNLPE